MKKSSLILLLALVGVFVLPSLASAHILLGTRHGWHDGFAHPFSGLDHLLAMFAVGLWAAQHRGRALWMIPLTFVGVMTLGGVLGLSGAFVPSIFFEVGIALSVLVLGVLIATSTKMQLSWGMCIVGLFALCHGYAHGHEMSAAVSAIPFSAGFIAATLILHAMGIAVGLLFQKYPRTIQLAGGAIAVCSVCFFANLV